MTETRDTRVSLFLRNPPKVKQTPVNPVPKAILKITVYIALQEHAFLLE